MTIKKLLLVAASTAALLSSTALAESENTFYVKVEGGANKMDKANDKLTGVKMKSKTAGLAGIEFGYYIVENVRAGLGFTHYFNPELKKSGTVNTKKLGTLNNATIKHKGTINVLWATAYYDIPVNVMDIFFGFGVGWVPLKEKITVSSTDPDEDDGRSTSASVSTKKANNFAYKAILGMATEVSPGTKIQGTFSFSDFGKTKSKKGYDQNNNAIEIGKTRWKGFDLTAGVRFDI